MIFLCVLTQTGPSTAGRDWLLSGDEYGRMKFGNLPRTAGRDWPLYGDEYNRMKLGDVPGGDRELFPVNGWLYLQAVSKRKITNTGGNNHPIIV